MKRLRLIFAGAALAAMLPLTAQAGPVNVNTADAETISTELKGVGLSRAQAIVAYRQQHGPFKSAEDLIEVKGIGQRTIDINRDFIRTGPAAKPDK